MTKSRFRKRGWSFEESDWKSLEELANIKNGWTKLEFAEPSIMNIPQKPGVYIFCASIPIRKSLGTFKIDDIFSALYSTLYVGRSKNLRKRYLEHFNKNDLNTEFEYVVQVKKLYSANLDYWFYQTISENEAKKYETALIKFFLPPANKNAGEEDVEENVKATIGQGRPA